MFRRITTRGQRMNDTAIANIIRKLANGSTHPDQTIYAKSFFELSKFEEDNGRRYLNFVKQIRDWGRYNGQRLLEIGCGFGWDAATLSMLGGNTVVATDILSSMIEGLQESFAKLRSFGLDLPVQGEVADGCSLPYDDNSFDGVYSTEAIEHVHDLERMFDNVKRVLRPGGRFVVVNDSNALNTKFREETFKMWEQRDASFDHAEFLKTVRPVEHANAEPYQLMRERIVREANKNLSDMEVEKIVAATAGLIRREIATLAEVYQSGMSLPMRPKYRWCRNPETGEYAERLLDPFELRDMLTARGFKVKIGHGFQRTPLKFANALQFAPLNRYLFDFRGLFFIAASKTA